jgi:hypothetical protein
MAPTYVKRPIMQSQWSSGQQMGIGHLDANRRRTSAMRDRSSISDCLKRSMTSVSWATILSSRTAFVQASSVPVPLTASPYRSAPSPLTHLSANLLECPPRGGPSPSYQLHVEWPISVSAARQELPVYQLERASVGGSILNLPSLQDGESTSSIN